MLYLVFTYMYTKTFLIHLIKAWERTSKKKRDGEIGEYKVNEMEAMNIK